MNAVQALGSRRTLEISPFIANWHPFVERIERQGPSWSSPKRNLEERLANMVKGEAFWRSDISQVAEAIINLIEPSGQQHFQRLSREMIQALVAELEVTDVAKLDYLMPIVNLAKRQPILTIGTLNYDLTLESIFETASVALPDTVDSWSEKGFVEVPVGGPRLPVSAVRRRTATDQDPVHPALIFGGRNKLQADGPYLDLLRAFAADLEEAQELVVVGYSFRDDHVNTTIRTWFNRDSRRTLTVIDPAFDKSQESFVGTLKSYVKERLTVHLLGAKEGLTRILDENASEPVPRLEE
jgi:hypothetical protein